MIQTMRRVSNSRFVLAQDDRLGPRFRAVYLAGECLGHIEGRSGRWRPVVVGMDPVWRPSMADAAYDLWLLWAREPGLRLLPGKVAA